MVLKAKSHSNTAKIILKLSVCVFLNIGLLHKTVILNYSNADVVNKNIFVITRIILKHSVCVFLNILLVENSHFKLFDYMASSTDVVKKNYTITCLYYVCLLYTSPSPRD